MGTRTWSWGWGNFAVISSTLGVTGNRLCLGEGLRISDIGCPSYAPYVTPAGLVGICTATPTTALEVSGTISATHFVGNGSGLTGVTAGATDRIISGTNNATSMIAISNTGYISITQGVGSTNTGWFDPTHGLVALGVSATGPITGTRGYFTSLGINTSNLSSPLVVAASTAPDIKLRPNTAFTAIDTVLGDLNFAGLDTGAGNEALGAKIEAAADQTWSGIAGTNNNARTRLVFSTNNATAVTERRMGCAGCPASHGQAARQRQLIRHHDGTMRSRVR